MNDIVTGSSPSAENTEEEILAGLEDKFDELFGKKDKTEIPKRSGSSQAVRKMTASVNEPSSRNAKAEMSGIVCEVKRIRKELRNSVYGQDNAINVFATGYFQARMLAKTDCRSKHPCATFLFAGPPGTGKTFLAEKAAEVLGLPFMRVDMSEYADKEANLEFCGSDRVYKNAKPGNVTSFVAANPGCVLLFDEIEKAHINVIHLFLQLLDAGRLRDNYTDKEVSFSDAVIIITTNAGKQLYEDSEDGDFSSVPGKVIIKALQKDINPQTGMPFFPAAVCSRFAAGNVVMFNRISAHHLRDIAKGELERQIFNFEKESGIRVKVDEGVYSALLFSLGGNPDARAVRCKAETFFNNELFELLRLTTCSKTKKGIEGIERIKISLELDDENDEIKKLFTLTDKPQVLVFADPETAVLCRDKFPGFDFYGVSDTENAVELMKSRKVDFVLLDIKYGFGKAYEKSLNIEDAQSSSRDFLSFLRERKKDIPVYLIEYGTAGLSEEEKISFMRRGVRDVLSITKNRASVEKRLNVIASFLHQQSGIVRLAKENKLITFETAQFISANGKTAEIRLFDFRMETAVDAEDAENILSAVSKPDVYFDDVIGADDAKKELAYFVEYLKNPEKYMGTGVKAPGGVILYGPPGTGKTMLAKAMACEAGVTFIVAQGNQFLKKYAGEGARKVHELFRTARRYAPSILFVDEIDSFAKERKGTADGFHGTEEILTAFLTEMDGFYDDPSRPVFVLAATNFDVEPGKKRSLDSALIRRFDRKIYIDLPDRADRKKFLKQKIGKNTALQISDAQTDSIAVRSVGMSLAELDSVVELALRCAIREGCTAVNDAIIEEAFELFNFGEAKKWDASQLERIARHEAGHTLIGLLSGEAPSYLTVVARGSHGGYMLSCEQEGKIIYTKDELLSDIRISLGGRAAELVYYGEREGLSTAASGDLFRATELARRIVCIYGMDEEFGPAVVRGSLETDGEMSVGVRTAVNRILTEQMNETVLLISQNREKIDALVEALMLKNHLNGTEIQQVFSGEKVQKCTAE